MGDSFFTPPPADEPVPPGVDQFDVPAPNFAQIGEQFAQGVKKAGGFFWKTVDIVELALKIIGGAIGMVLSMLLCLIAFLIGLFNRMYEGAEPGVDAIASRSLEHVFGVSISGSGPRKLARNVDSTRAAEALGKSITDALTQGVQLSAGGTLAPSSAASEAFLGKVSRIGIEGWVEGMIGEALTAGQFKALMELVPLMAQVLGLGRLSRRVLAPPLQILVEDPYTWKLNAQYRPKLLSADAAVHQFLRGRITRDQLDTELGRQGYAADRIEALINQNTLHLSTADVDYLVARGHWSTEQGVQTLKDAGYDDATAHNVLSLASQKRLDTLNLQLLDAQLQAYIDGEIDEGAMQEAVRQAPLTDGEKALLAPLTILHRQLKPRHMTLAQVETAIRSGIMTIDDLRAWLTRENYPPDEQLFIELTLLGEITDAADAAAKRKKAEDEAAKAKAEQLKARQAKEAAAALKLKNQGVSLAQEQTLVKAGLRSFDEYRTFLANEGIGADAIADLVDLLHQQIDERTAADKAAAEIRAAAAVKHIPLSQVEKAVQAGTLSLDELHDFMVKNGFAAADIAIVLNLNQAELDAAKQRAEVKANAAALAAEKHISLADLERAARLGLTSVADYTQALTDAGFDPTSRDLLIAILQDQLVKDQAAEDARTASGAAAAAKHISLADLERAVRAGLRPMADYRAALVALNFSADDTETLVGLLQLAIANDRAVEQKKKDAAAALQSRQLSLAQLERAVKLGVLTIDDYSAELAAAGFSPADVQTLSLSLLAEVQATKAAAERQNAIANQLAQKQISLAQEKDLVRGNLQTLDGYGAFLIAQGYSAEDAAQLRALFALQLDQEAAAAAAHEQAAARAAGRSISLSAEEKAVVDGIRTMDDYVSLLFDLGFNEVDAATLVALLSDKVAAARAKAAS